MVTAALVTFLNNPQTYIQGATNLIVDPIAKPIVANHSCPKQNLTLSQPQV